MTNGAEKIGAAVSSTKSFYERLYNVLGEKSDSPDKSRDDVRRALMKILREVGNTMSRPFVLNIGSGPQLLEHQLLHSYKDKPDKRLLRRKISFWTVDLADIESKNLKAAGHINVHHMQADATELRFREGFGVVISNMAIDFAPREALSRAADALAPDGRFIFTLHHPHMMQNILAETKDESVRAFIQQGLDSKAFYESENQIRETFAAHGLTVESVKEQREGPMSAAWKRSPDSWWLVEGVKAQKRG